MRSHCRDAPPCSAQGRRNAYEGINVEAGGPQLRVVTQIVFGAVSAVALGWSALQTPADLPLARAAGYRGLTALALFFLSAYLCLHLRASFRKARFALLLACFTALAFARGLLLLDVVVAIGSAMLLRELGGATGELAGFLLLFPPQPVPSWLAAALAVVLVLHRWAWLAPVSAALACAAVLAGADCLCNAPAGMIGLLCAGAASSARDAA